MLRKSILTLVLALAGIFGVQEARAGDGSEPVVLTVTGNVANPNRGARDSFEDKVFEFMEVEFDKAFVFTLPELRALPQRSIKVQYPDWPREIEATGPSLLDVVKAAGAEGATVSVQAIDGYVFEFKSEDVARDKMILALSTDGKALSFGGRGPIWLPGPMDSFAGQEGEEGVAVAAVHINVQ